MAAAAATALLAFAATATAGYRLVILSDRTGGHHEGIYPSIIREINLLKPDIVVTVGDQIEGYGDDMETMSAEWDSLLAMLDVLEAPVYLTPGNHDIWSDDSEELFRQRTGFDPYYSFDYEGTRFIILDTSRAEAWDQVDEEQLAWLASDLSEVDVEDQVFVFYHKPFWLMTTAAGVSDPVHELFVERGVDGVFSGHFHQFFSGTYDGIPYTSLGSSGGYVFRPETEPVARGEFFQFCWVTVGDDGFDLAVVDAGNLYPIDFHTVDDDREIAMIESEYVTVSPLRASGGGDEAVEIIVTVENMTPAVIDDEIRWDAPDGWTIEPPRTPVLVAPDAVGEFPFSVRAPEAIYPAPSFALTYPMSNGMELDAAIQLPIVRTASASRFPAHPHVDGALSEPCWAGAAPVDRFYPAYEGYEVDGGTEFRFGCDDENLYVSAVCFEPAVSEMVTNAADHDDAVYRDDCVGFFIQPDTDEMVVYQVYVNSAGVVFDQRIEFDEAMFYTTHREWDGEYEVGTRVSEDRWVVEAVIPFAELDAAPGPGLWKVNFRRRQQRTESAADWQVPIDYNPNTFGELVLE